MATRKQLLDQNDNEILPITDTESVRNPQNIGGTLESRLQNIKENIDANNLLVEQSSLTNEQRIQALANVSNQTANSTTGKMGYKVLQPYDQSVDGSQTFAEQIEGLENYIFEIRDVFDLNKGSVTIPANCILKFNGGMLKNGMINGNHTKLEGDIKFDLNISFSGTFDIDTISPLWFGAKSQPTPQTVGEYNSAEDQAPFFNKAVTLIPYSNGEFVIPEGFFIIKAPIVWIGDSIRINGNPKTSVIAFGKPTDEQQTTPIVFDFNINTVCSGYIKNFRTHSLTHLSYNNVFSKGIIFNNLYFRGGLIERVYVYRAGIFIKGFLTNVTKVTRCSITGLGYAFLSAYSEDDYNNASGKASVLVDSEISSCYINATTAFEASQTYSRSVFAGSISSSIVRNNYIDFFRYIYLGCNDGMGSYYLSNRIEANVFDYIFSFCKTNLVLKDTVISQNVFNGCSWNAAKGGSWDQYSTNDPEYTVKGKTWIVFRNVVPRNAKIEGNIYSDDVDVILSLGSEVNGYNFVYKDSGIEKCIQVGRIFGNSLEFPSKTGVDTNFSIGDVLITNDGGTNFRKTTYATFPFKGYEKIQYNPISEKQAVYKIDDSQYYDLYFPAYEYGRYNSFDLKPFMAEFMCYDKSGNKLENKTYTIDGEEETIPVALYNDKVVGCFSKDFKKLYDLDEFYKVAGDYSTSHNVKIFDLGVSVGFVGFPNGQLNLIPYSSQVISQHGFDSRYFVNSTDPSTGNFIGRIIYNSTEDKFKIYGYDGWEVWQGIIPLRREGTTAQRPNKHLHSYFVIAGMTYYDTTLGKTIMYDGNTWVNLDGTPLVNYTIAANIDSNITIDNAAVSIDANKTYLATLAANTDYTIDTVTVTMGGVDVTSFVYNSSTGVIYIASVTGNIVITATATQNL